MAGVGLAGRVLKQRGSNSVTEQSKELNMQDGSTVKQGQTQL
jgi:hypothetical protein